jgi:hypothetical protein
MKGPKTFVSLLIILILIWKIICVTEFLTNHSLQCEFDGAHTKC